MNELITKLGIAEGYKKALALHKSIPVSGDIPVDLASVLQTKCWLMSMDLTTIHTKTEIYEGTVKIAKDNAFNSKRAECEEKTEEAKKRYAYNSDEVKALASEHKVAEALVNNIASLKKFFENGVYVMRSRQDKERRDWQAAPTSEV